MYWVLQFAKLTEKTSQGLLGQEVKEVRFFTSSPVKRAEIVQLYQANGYILEEVETIDNQELPRGFEGRTIQKEDWQLINEQSIN